MPRESAERAAAVFELKLALQETELAVLDVAQLKNPLAQQKFARRTAGLRVLPAFVADHEGQRAEEEPGALQAVDVGSVTAETLAAARWGIGPTQHRLVLCHVAVGVRPPCPLPASALPALRAEPHRCLCSLRKPGRSTVTR